MPVYGYHCKNEECDHSFEEIHKMSDFNIPCEAPCPECKQEGTIERIMFAPKIVAGVNMRSKVPDFFKDRLKDIKKASGRGCTIDV